MPSFSDSGVYLVIYGEQSGGGVTLVAPLRERVVGLLPAPPHKESGKGVGQVWGECIISVRLLEHFLNIVLGKTDLSLCRFSKM